LELFAARGVSHAASAVRVQALRRGVHLQDAPAAAPGAAPGGGGAQRPPRRPQLGPQSDSVPRCFCVFLAAIADFL